MAVLVVSSDPEELPDLCDRVLVMAEGRIVGELEGDALTRHRIIAASSGVAEQKRRMSEVLISRATCRRRLRRGSEFLPAMRRSSGWRS